MTKTTTLPINKQLQWFSHPQAEHLVQFYEYDNDLLRTLSAYVETGLGDRNTCIVIATPYHLEKLREKLNPAQIAAAKQREQYREFDAAQLLRQTRVKGVPQWSLFLRTVGTVMRQAAVQGQPTRVFSDMVALLWKEGNQEGVNQLEKYWNDVSRLYPFSLYCAYPRLYFDKQIHQQVLNDLQQCHSLVSPAFV